MTFRDRLREEIEYKGIQVKELAAKIGISNSTMLSYIDARAVVPNVETAVKIARTLGVSVEYLVTGEKHSYINTQSSNVFRHIISGAEKLSQAEQYVALDLINSINLHFHLN